MNILILDQISLTVAGRQLVENFSTSISPGMILTIMGSSGSGKSSLLRYVSGFLDEGITASGRVFLNKTEITSLPPYKRRIGLLFQDALLLPHLSVAGNLMFGINSHDLQGNKRSKSTIKQMINHGLCEAGLPDAGDAYPDTLSGGEKARIALMQLLLSEPQALLLDEPFSKLDADLRDHIRSFTFSHVRKAQLPVLLVTHDVADAEKAGGSIINIQTI